MKRFNGWSEFKFREYIEQLESKHEKEIEELKRQNEIMKKALKYYGNDKNCYYIEGYVGDREYENEDEDGGTYWVGKNARQALREVEDE